MDISDAKQPQPDPVVMLAGGPGQSALQSFPSVASAFGDVLRVAAWCSWTSAAPAARIRSTASDRRQVGATGGRSPEAARRAAAECLHGLPGDPRFYTTSDAVADLE